MLIEDLPVAGRVDVLRRVFFTDGSVFSRDATEFVDDATGTTWNILGEAVRGPRKGEHLEPVTHLDTFWFAWSSYRPDTTLVG
jgi:hypothetical protein